MEKKIGFAIIGCGRIAQRHAEHIAKFGKLIAVCDSVKEKADALANTYNSKSFGSIDELLNNLGDIDVVSICSPNGLHAKHTIQCLNNGVHVLCEKPLAISVNDCGEMIKAAEKNNKRLFAIKQNRFNPPVEAVKQAIDQGKLGKIYSIQLNCFWNRNEEYYHNSWKGTKDMDGREVPNCVPLSKIEIEMEGDCMCKLAEYPWEQCIEDQMKRYESKEIAEAVCGMIRSKYGS